MKYMDRVRVLTDDYVEFGIHKGDMERFYFLEKTPKLLQTMPMHP